MEPPRILLVEDNPDEVELFRRAFRKMGAEPRIAVAADGEEAAGALSTPGARPDLVVLDLKLPRMGGLELLAWIRERPELARVPVVVFTASEEREDIGRAKELGVAAYFVKPGGFVETCESARRMLALARAIQEGTPFTPEFPAGV